MENSLVNSKDVYNIYQERILRIAEVDRAEEAFRKIYDKIAKRDRELADQVDSLIGTIVSAYEVQGFNGGLMAARGAL